MVKLGDFGTARDMHNPNVPAETHSKRVCIFQVEGAGTPSGMKQVLKHYVGTPNFMAPEVIMNKENDYRSDMWSLGCTVYQADYTRNEWER